MRSSGADDLGDAMFAIIAVGVNLVSLALRVAIPLVLALALTALQAQHAVLDMLFARLAHLVHHGAPLTASVRFGATVAFYACIVAPATLMSVVLAMNISLLAYACGAGALVGAVAGAFGLMRPSDNERDVLSALRFWE